MKMTLTLPLKPKAMYDWREDAPEELRPEGDSDEFQTVHSLVAPPIGFFPFDDDEIGCYWPLGREEQAPLVTRQHGGSLAPVGSTPQYYHATEVLKCDESNPHRSHPGNGIVGVLKQNSLDPIPDISAAAIEWDDYPSLLAVDPSSPYYLMEHADRQVAAGELESGASCYRRALELIPDYTAVHYGLGMLYRRMRRQVESTRHLLKSIQYPICLYGHEFLRDSPSSKFRFDGPKKALQYLKRTPQEIRKELNDEPLMAFVDKLTFAYGFKTNDEYQIYSDVIEKFAESGRHEDAIRLWTRYGEMMQYETVSFRARYGFTQRVFGERLLSLVDAAGLSLRATLIKSMLERLQD